MNCFCSGIVLGKTKDGNAIIFSDIFGKIIINFAQEQKRLILGSTVKFSTMSKNNYLVFQANGFFEIDSVPRATTYFFLEKTYGLISFFNSVLPLEMPCNKTFLVLQKGAYFLENKYCYKKFILFEAAWLARFALTQGVFGDLPWGLQDLFENFINQKSKDGFDYFLEQKINNIEKSSILIENLIATLKGAF